MSYITTWTKQVGNVVVKTENFGNHCRGLRRHLKPQVPMLNCWYKGHCSPKFTSTLKAMFIYNNEELIGIFRSRNEQCDRHYSFFQNNCKKRVLQKITKETSAILTQAGKIVRPCSLESAVRLPPPPPLHRRSRAGPSCSRPAYKSI